MTIDLSASVSASHPRLPVSDVYLGGSRVPSLIVKKVVITTAEGLHDGVELTCSMPFRDLRQLSGAPIQFRFGIAPDSGRFTGYVRTAEKSQKLSDAIEVEIKCIGATSPMSGIPLWGLASDIRLTDLVNQIDRAVPCGVYHAGLDQSAVLQRLSFGGDNLWRLLQSIAPLLRRRVVNREGVVWLVDPLEELRTQGPLLQLNKSMDNFGSGDRALLDFVPTSGPTSSPFPLTGWFGDDGEARILSPSEEFDVEWQGGYYLTDDAHAELVRRGWEWSTTARTETATARTKGNASIYNGTVVSVRTGLGRVIESATDGLWFVERVRHHIEGDDFQTHLTLSRDRYRPSATPGRYEPFYTRTGAGYPGLRLDDDQWVSTWSR